MTRPKDIKIERVLTDDKGHITGLDIHDEDFGEAVFLEAKGRHFHGYYKQENQNPELLDK